MNCFHIICELNIKKIIFSSENENFEIHKTNEYTTKHVSHGNRYLQNLFNLTNTTTTPLPLPLIKTIKSAKPPKSTKLIKSAKQIIQVK